MKKYGWAALTATKTHMITLQRIRFMRTSGEDFGLLDTFTKRRAASFEVTRGEETEGSYVPP